ncbi:response regulator receiver protein [Planococcus kocurii]|uniref:histidine kinase n=1 Tax=Planococcus kocurii TaxID=1374 RepID=A0ABM5WUH1_9BACL|nr:response regulator receiver protein [Planococcus kocurii]
MNNFYQKTSISVKVCCIFLAFFFLSDTEKIASTNDSEKVVLLSEEDKKKTLSKNLQILEDVEGTLRISELQSPPYSWKFSLNENGIPNMGFSSDVYWVKFTIENRAETEEWLLELANPFLDHVVLYSPEPSGGFSITEFGETMSDSKKLYSSRSPVFKLPLLNKGENTFFMKIESQGVLYFPVTVWEHAAYDAKSQQMTAMIGLVSGISLLFFGWCIYSFFKYRQKNFLYLLILAVSLLFTAAEWTGLNFTYIWPDFKWGSNQTILVACGAASLMTFFILKELLSGVLNIHWLSMVIKWMVACVLFSVMVSFFSYSLTSLFSFASSALTIVLTCVLAFSAWQKGISYAAPYTAALFVSIAILTISFLTAMGVLPYIETVQYAVYVISWSILLLAAKALLKKEKMKLEKTQQLERQANDRQLLKVTTLKNDNKRKDELLAFASNGLRTPLYGVIGIAESLQQSASGKMSPQMITQLDELVTSSKNMAHLINDVVDFSKQKPSSLQRHTTAIALDELCTNVIAIYKPLLKNEAVKLYHTVPASLPKPCADPDRLRQILSNLVNNSIEHTRVGEIVLSARIFEGDLEISVKDTGNSIEEKKIPIFFEWNIPQEKPLRNHGMDLKITKNLIELQGGTLKLESLKESGSLFIVTLPICTDASNAPLLGDSRNQTKELTASQLADSLLKQRPTKKNLHVLVIETDEINRLVLLRQLISANYQAVGVEDGKTALHLLSHQSIDLIVMDGSLTDMTSDELCKLIRLEYTLTEMPILMLSDADSLQEKKDAFTAGANDYLLKPCDKEEFLLRVKTLANMRSLTQEITNLNYFLERNVNERTMALEITNMNLLTVNDEIQEIEKSRNEMLSAISHELGTPITLIHSYIQAVKESLIEENNPRYLDMIHKKLLLLERLTEDLVELTKYKSGHMTLRFLEKDSLVWIARLAESMASDVTQSGRVFEFFGTKNPDNISHSLLAIDLDRLDQVISNILWNSVKHTSPEEGKITLSMEIVANNNDNALLDEESDGELVVRIADNGSGIKKEALPYIFDRFYKINRSASYKGSGLGLAIAKEIVLAHKGQIWADSIEGQGSVFVIVLPLTFQ